MKETTPDNAQPTTAAPTNEAATVTVGQLVTPEPPTPAAETIPARATTPAAPATLTTADSLVEDSTLPPGKGKGNRSLADYARLDWSKSNADLARIAGVSRQRIAQIRQELKDKAETEALADSPSEIAGFSNGTPPPTEPIAAAAAAPATPPVNYRLMAETTFAMSTGLMTMIVGPEWQPRMLKLPDGKEVDEKEAVVEAIRAYFEAKQIQDLPPGYMLAFVVASYAAPRFSHENTRSKFKTAWQWCKLKVGALFFKIKGRKFTPTILPKQSTKETIANEN